MARPGGHSVGADPRRSTCRRSRRPPTPSPTPRSRRPGAISRPPRRSREAPARRCRRRLPTGLAGPDPAVAELRGRVEALEGRPAAAAAAPPPQHRPPKPTRRWPCCGPRSRPCTPRCRRSTECTGQREQTKALGDALTTRNAGEQKALAAARASAVIGIAARLSAALDSGLPFAADLALLAPLAQGDAKLAELVAEPCSPRRRRAWPRAPRLAASFPAMAKAALADDVADDFFGERLLGKVKGLVSLRRVGDDVQGDSAEAKLARAEAALECGRPRQGGRPREVAAAADQRRPRRRGWPAPRRILPPSARSTSSPRRPSPCWARRGNRDDHPAHAHLVRHRRRRDAGRGVAGRTAGHRHRRVARLAARHQRRRAR